MLEESEISKGEITIRTNRELYPIWRLVPHEYLFIPYEKFPIDIPFEIHHDETIETYAIFVNLKYEKYIRLQLYNAQYIDTPELMIVKHNNVQSKHYLFNSNEIIFGNDKENGILTNINGGCLLVFQIPLKSKNQRDQRKPIKCTYIYYGHDVSLKDIYQKLYRFYHPKECKCNIL